MLSTAPHVSGETKRSYVGQFAQTAPEVQWRISTRELTYIPFFALQIKRGPA